MEFEQVAEDNTQLEEDLAKIKKLISEKNNELSQVKLDQSLSIEELLKRQPEVLRSLNRVATRSGNTPKIDMQSRFMNYKNLK